ncbi:MAG: peptidylprolyl isomerase [Candidatus Bathyarchaeota archaeon]|nr:peptidylprolyl isomerase [Candidatus Bathyarchaeota archaeon]
MASSKNPEVLIKTSLGDIKVQIYPEKAPVTSGNFLRYVDDGLYDGTSFFRTVTMMNQPNDEVKIEVIQGGQVPKEKEYEPIILERTTLTGLKHLDGVISMGRFKPDSAKSSFFFCIGDQPELDFGGKRNPDGQGFAAFGQVVEGMDVVRAIQVQPHEEQRLTPPIVIHSITMINE